MKQIHTREQLEEEIRKIIESNVDACGHIEDQVWNCATEICDLIADLPNLCFHSKVDSSSSSST